jgi:magnesium transporter
LLKYGPKALIHGLLDTIVDGYFDAIGTLDDAIEALEDELFEESASAARGVQRSTFRLRKALVVARRAVLPMREVVNTVTRGVTDGGLNTDLAPYFADLYDHVIRAAEWTESLRDMISSVFETTLSLSDVRMNMIMKKLTGWAAIIAVPTAVTGYFGQNVPYPGFGQSWGFWLSLVSILLIAAALYVTFRRKDWL